jgi:hypothetical protein
MARLVVVPGQLEGEPAVVGEPIGPPREQLQVMRHPLEHGIRDDHVDRRFGPPVPHVFDPEAQAPRPSSSCCRDALGGRDHVRRRVDPQHIGVGPALRQGGGQLAWAAPEIDN